MTLPAFARRPYHRALRALLPLFGLDFGWYEAFHTKWPYALPAVEAWLQHARPRSRSRRFFAAYPLERFARPGDTVLDIGANIGAVSTHLLRLGYVVHAYEPDARCAEFLRRRFARIDPSRFRLHHQAVSNYTGVATLYRGTRTTESSSILEHKPGTEQAAGYQVTVRSIGDVLDSVEHASLILMDVEGAEYAILNEMLTPRNRDKFGLCIAESHARKIPGLEAEHGRVLEAVERLGMQDRVLLDWH
ncbi:MAG TPA: FkbM family methyltransferase [Candidatus Krumholzibacteria bacterium]|nr:FkbM family methyltransferase [Candidatus Krumholzibacteria bacterium]